MMGRVAVKFIFLTCVSILGVSCSHPSDKAITSFADSTAAITSVASSAATLQTDIDDKTTIVAAATDFAASGHLAFPPPQGGYLDPQFKKDLALRSAVLKAIGAYAKALADANDPALAKSVSDTTTNLSTAMADFQSAVATRSGSASAAQKIKLVGGIIADAAELFTEMYTAQQLRAVMAKVHPKLEELNILLKADLSDIDKNVSGLMNAYRRAAADRLQKIDLTPAQRYDAYMAMASDYAGLKTRVALLRSSSDGLDAMVAAHKAIIESSDDNRAVMSLLTFAKNLADRAKQLRDVSA